jgi:hypothetical protein
MLYENKHPLTFSLVYSGVGFTLKMLNTSFYSDSFLFFSLLNFDGKYYSD